MATRCNAAKATAGIAVLLVGIGGLWLLARPGHDQEGASAPSLPFLAPEAAVAAPLRRAPRPERSKATGRVSAATWAVLEEGLAAHDYATRLFATEAIGCVHTPAAVAQLTHQLGDPEEDVRIAAVASLRRQPGSSALRALETVRDDEQESLVVRVLAAAALVSPPQPCH